MIVKLKNWSIYFIGILFLSLGVTLMLLSDLGSGGWDVLTYNLSCIFKIKLGTSLFVLAGVLILATSLIKKKQININALLVSFISGKFINFWYYIIFKEETFEELYIKIFMVIIGVIIISLGCCIMFITKLPKNHTEIFIFAIAEKFSISYKLAKTIIDSLALIAALFLGYYLQDFSNIGLGTILNTFFTGYLIHILNPIVESIYLRII